MLIITSVEAQNRLGQLLDTVQREPVAITRDGQVVAFIVSPQEMEDVLDARRRRSKAVADFEAWSERAKEHRRAGADMLTDEDVLRLVHTDSMSQRVGGDTSVLSEAAFKAVWDNSEDDTYDAL
jgi:antitoxin Phd